MYAPKSKSYFKHRLKSNPNKKFPSPSFGGNSQGREIPHILLSFRRNCFNLLPIQPCNVILINVICANTKDMSSIHLSLSKNKNLL